MTFGWAHLVIVLAALQRLAELPHAQRNTRALLARGAREYGATHYPAMVILHAAWLAAMFWFTQPAPTPQWFWLGLFVACQAIRVWLLAALGPYWTTRVIVLDRAPPIRSGPYRYLRHPNYLVVAIEMPALPLGLEMPMVALVFGLLNLVVLAVRIRVEDAARQGLG